MGAKKKNKANKLARMSEEEKMRYLQHRAAVEEEARRRKEQLLATFMKNKLKREEVFSRLNMAKINEQWRQKLRQIKCVELRKDLEDLFKWFDYSFTKKNRIIEILLDDLNEAESQYSRMHQSHTEAIDKLIKIHGQRMEHFSQLYVQERDEIYCKSKADLQHRITGYTADEENLQATLYKMEEACQEKIASMSSKHFSKIDELRNTMLTELENLQTTMELRMEKIWSNFESVLKEYWKQTEDRRRQYVVMRATDHENCKQILENNHQINAVTETLNYLKDQLNKVQTASREQFLECQAKKEDARQRLHSLKKAVGKEIENDKKKLILLNTVATKTTEDFKIILAKGEQILELQSLCRKLETLNEKVCPEGFDKPQLTEEEENEISQETKKFSEPLAEKTFNEVLKLNGFWNRYNRVLLEKEALSLHYKSLQNEQKLLKSTLRNYLSDLAVKKPESKISSANGVQIHCNRPQSCATSRGKFSFSTLTYPGGADSPSVRQIMSAGMRKWFAPNNQSEYGSFLLYVEAAMKIADGSRQFSPNGERPYGDGLRDVAGRNGHPDGNPNGKKVANGLAITNAFFQHKDIHTYIWYCDSMSQKSMIDFVMVQMCASRMTCGLLGHLLPRVYLVMQESLIMIRFFHTTLFARKQMKAKIKPLETEIRVSYLKLVPNHEPDCIFGLSSNLTKILEKLKFLLPSPWKIVVK